MVSVASVDPQLPPRRFSTSFSCHPENTPEQASLHVWSRNPTVILHVMWSSSDFNDDFGSPFEMHLEALPHIFPNFRVPSLEDKPQNPIIDTLQLEYCNTHLSKRLFQPEDLPEELALLTLEQSHLSGEASYRRTEKLWENAVHIKRGVQNGILSWDRLKSTRSKRASPTAFLSEQDDLLFAAARHHVQPSFDDHIDSVLQVTEHQLFRSLKTAVLGFSSPYHVWDPREEKFTVPGTAAGVKRRLVLTDGKDETVVSSITSRFLKIGALLRRLESLLSSLRTRPAKEGPTIHAFAHSLSTVIDYIRHCLAECPPSEGEIASDMQPLHLFSIWRKYAIYEDYLVALTDLCQRSESTSPESYSSLDSSPISLLSRIYEHLIYHYEHNSPAKICAMFAFLLTNSSHDYLQEIAHSVGIGGLPPKKRSKTTDNHIGQYDLGADEEKEEDIFDLLDEVDSQFPCFFPQTVLQALPAAQKSLILYQIAQPDSAYISPDSMQRHVGWIWTKEEILATWNDSTLSRPSPVLTAPHLPPLATVTHYLPDLSFLQLYDLEPGSALSSEPLQVQAKSDFRLRNFIDSFPDSLPAITPTLSELASLTFKDLLDHASTLSRSLLDLFIKSEGMLNFRAHLVLLRSYLLVASPAFKSRLLSALYSDAGEYGVDLTAHSMTIQSLHRRPGREKESKQPWAVGLSPHLLERDKWPPVGADLSFYLRTVIVDSLDPAKEDEEGKLLRDQIVTEAEWRLGFAIRDLPTGKGRGKWLDPLSIEALDFLYMDYKPPRPLEILIPPEVLAKYQRMFTFILRLFRVESALKSLFRMTTHRAIATYLFPTLTPSRKLLLHFRFIAQTFVSSLSGYVFDTAIGGNFDPFLERLVDKASSEMDGHDELGVSDVFELAQRHSDLLDDILTACMLRSGQRGIGDLLRQCLELILEFTIVVGELHRGRLQEYQAAPTIEDLFRKFSVKTTTLVKVLKGLVDKGSSSTTVLTSQAYNSHDRRPTGGVDALYHLLTRLDLTDWWRKSGRR